MSNYRVIYLDNGKTATVHKDNAQKYADMGYKIGPAAESGSRASIDRAIRNDTPGSKWVDDGKTNYGNILMNKPGSNTFSSVNARYADKYFDLGYTLDPRSQSVNRALSSDYFKMEDAANAAIRNGTYSQNGDYYRDDYVSGGYYDRDVQSGLFSNNNYYNSSIDRALGRINNDYSNMYQNNQDWINNINSGFGNMQNYINTQLQKLEQSIKDNDMDMIEKLLADSKRVGYNLNLNNNNTNYNPPTTNNYSADIVQNTSQNNYNNMNLGNYYSGGNVDVKKARSNMSDDEYVKFMESVLGF